MTEVPPAAVRRRIESWLAGDSRDGSPVLALRARPEWPGEPHLTVDGTTVRVVGCPTPLAARAAIHERDGAERLVLLTELDDNDLGDGILAHVSGQRVRSISQWDVVRQLFDAAGLDPALVAEAWAAMPLVDHVPEGGWTPVRGTVLTRSHALRCLTGHLLGLDRDEIDSAGLLQATIRPRKLLTFADLPTEVTRGIRDFVVATAGPAAAPIMAAVLSGHGADAVPLGLLAGALWSDDAATLDRTMVAVSRTRLEPRFGRPTEEEARALSQAAEAWIQRLVESDRATASRMMQRAEEIAAELDMVEQLRASTTLPLGFTHRLRDLAQRIREALDDRRGVRPETVGLAEVALAALGRHRNADESRMTTPRHAVRLLRWLAGPDSPAPATLYDALLRQVRIDGWVDRAKLAVHAGSVDPTVGDAYRRLFQEVDARRARHDEQFAAFLADRTRADAEPGTLLYVEDVLDRVVAPILAAGRQVLLLVLDGMSVAAATQLAESVTRTGSWGEMTPAGGARTGVLAALPTVTEVSRCSLLSGTIAVGKQAEERTALTARFPDSLLLHKHNLRAGAGTALDREVVRAVADPGRPLVAAVVNTIDDALDRSEPGTTDWNLESIRAVSDLLAHADERVVVAVSDHGHVVDRGPEGVTVPGPGGGNRWRPATRPARNGEIEMTGRRVALAGGHVVLPWREQLRYGPLKSGYHGGASPAEAVIPLLVFSRRDEEVAGWASAPVASPDWWREPLAEKTPSAPPVVRRPARRPTPPPSDSLFDLREPTSAAPAPTGRPSLVDRLLASELYTQRRDTRAPLPDERVAAMLDVLLSGGGRASLDTLAARAGVPAHRIRGTVTQLQKLLQVEGYPVLEMDPDGRTVHLDHSLLREQFGLGPA